MEIKNEHQYHITKAWAERFALAIDKLQEMDPLLMKIKKDALQSQLDDLNTQIKNYEISNFIES